MAIFLVQHGKSLSGDIDPEKGLSEEGISETERIATVARGYEVYVSCIRHSGKKRAIQTAEIFYSALKPENGIRQTSGLNPLDDVTAFADTINSDDDIMFVGHLPFMERLTSCLITGTADRPVFKCQNSGILCLDKYPGTQDWVIKWSLMPNIG